MKKFISRLMILTATLVLVGCIEPEENAPSTITYDVEEILRNPNLSPAQKSEQLALVGEALFTPAGFMYSNEVLDLAIAQDATNARAQLYKKVVSPLMQLKGILKRLDPVSKQFSPQTQANFKNLKGDVSVNPAVREFFLSGPADIRSEAQAQRVIDEVRSAQNSLRLHLRASKNTGISLHPMLYGVENINEIWIECPATGIEKTGSYHKKYTVKVCPYVQRVNVYADGGDFEALQHIVAGVQIMTGLASSYDLAGSSEVEKLLAKSPGSSEEKVFGFVRGLRSFGQLRDRAAMTIVQDMGTDIYSGARWIQANQDRFCPEGWNQRNRKGMVFSNGLCVQDHPNPNTPKVDTIFRAIETALAGSTLGVTIRDGRAEVSDLIAKDDQGQGGYETTANILAMFVKPIADVRTLLPTQFSRCGNSTNVGDATLGGTLPQGDGVSIAGQLGLINKPCN